MLVSKISSILSQIPLNVWEEIVKKEPEWEFMFDLFKRWEFGKFSVLMMAAGLTDYQPKRKTEKVTGQE